jgi:hypothetical protein
MKTPVRTLLSLVLAGIGIGAASAQQTLTFSNTDTAPGTPGNQNQVITLLAGSAVSIAPNGNLSASCALTGSLCTGTGGGSIDAPTLTLAATNFSAPPPDAEGRYAAGTTFTLTPTVGNNGEICVRSVSGTTPAGTNWPATLLAPFTAQTVVLPAGDSTYQFSMRCYNAGGAITATLPDIRTRPGAPPDGCAGFQVPLPAGWARGNLTETNEVVRVEGPGVWANFPESGASGYVITAPNVYHAIRFQTPTNPWTVANQQFFWEEAQQQGAASLGRVYISISSCPGDFRLPTRGSTAPANDPTFARGCRNFRDWAGFSNQMRDRIDYAVGTGPANEDTCQLAPGRSYYINFIRADPTDNAIGTPAQEASCNLLPPSSSCGVQMRYY